jgi:putative heme transporter
VLVGLAALVLGTEAVLVAPHLSGATAALAGAEAGWVGLAVLAVAASLTAFGMVRRRLLSAAGIRVGVASAVASILVSNAFHVTLPGGIAFSTAYSYRWMRDHGAGAPVAGWNLGVNGLLSTLTLAGLGLAASLASGGTGWVRLVVEIGGVALLAGGARRFLRRPDRAVAVAERLLAWVNLVLRRPPGTGAQRPAKIVAQLRSVRPGSRGWAVATTFALLNWVFDVACLAACAHATGTPGLTPTVVLVAYVAGMAASSVSLLPGGVGVVDGALVLGLVAGGVPAAAALSAVVLYRLVTLVGVVAAGWAVHGTHLLRSRPPRARGVSWPTAPRPAPVLR